MPASAQAQLSFVTPQPQSAADAAPLAIPAISDAVEQGLRLESERRWGEAVNHYEDAVRRFPAASALEDRLGVSRMHYDLSRRYGDASFRDAVGALPVDESLNQYSEVLLKIQSHYVEAPSWQRLVERGATALEVSLSDPVFVERNLAHLPQAKIDHFRRAIRTQLLPARVDSRRAARDAVAHVARSAHQQLGVSETAVVLEFTCGATNSLDPYSTYLTPDQLNEVYSQIEGNFVGLGVELKASDGNLLIVKVIPHSPAERAGIRADDRIIAVGGKTTEELSTDQAANLLQGPEGTEVAVTTRSPDGTRRQLRIRREQVEIPSIDQVKMLDSATGVGYLRLTCFQKTTSRDLDAALWQLHRQGMSSLVIDLRGNPGGLLTTSVEVVDRFVDRGVIVSTRGRSPSEDYSYSAHAQGTWRMPLVVLIDSDSASASEIFAGAIRDHRRGTIVGTRSYGKGSVQSIIGLSLASAGLRLTTAKFYSPLGKPISNVGVDPDVLVQQTAKPALGADGMPAPATVENDPVLAAALQVANQQVALKN